MKKIILFSSISTLLTLTSFSQENKRKPNFWDNVQFGGGLNVGVSNNATTIGVSPSAIYNVSDKFSTGVGVSYLYSKQKNSTAALSAYGASVLALYKPFEGVQLSSEFEQSFIKVANTSRSVPALYLGAGYNLGRNVTAGVRYDVLYNKDKSLFASPLTPFVRVYF